MAVKKRGVVQDSSQQLDLIALAQYIQLMTDQPNYLPSQPDLVKHCQDIVKCLARTSGTEEELWEVLQSVEEFLLRLVNKLNNNQRHELITAILDKFYSYTSDPQSDACPATSAVLIVLHHNSRESHKHTARWLVEKGRNCPAGAGLRATLSCLYRWLYDWHGTATLGDWVLAFIKALEENQRYDILIEVSIDNLSRLFVALNNPLSVCSPVADVIIHILASLRESTEALDAISPHVPRILVNLAADSGQWSRQLLQNVVDVLTIMIDHQVETLKGEALDMFKDKYVDVEKDSSTNPFNVQSSLEQIFVPAPTNLEPQPGPSQRTPFREMTNTALPSCASTSPTNVEPQPGPSQRTPLREGANTELPSCASTSQCSITKMQSQKEKELYIKCTKYMKRMCQLRHRIKKLKHKAVLNVLTDDSSIKKLSKKVTPTFALLLQAQIRNYKKKGCGHRWTKEEKIVALRLYKRSPTCYRLLRRMFNLPSPGTLKLLLNRVPYSVGINKPVLTVLNGYIKTLKSSDKEFILMFDEMSLKKHFEYDSKQDHIEGFQDHGIQGRSQSVASYALVFMIAGIRKPVKQPIAHYLSSGFSTADRLAVLIKEVLQNCFQAGLNIRATVCDMDGVNRRALTILGASVQKPIIKIDSKEIIAIFDVPHLLKCFRNLFLKYNIECVADITSDNKTGRGTAKWSHIKQFFEIDNSNPNFVFAPSLTKEHLEPNTQQKMKVKLAAQVFSHTVAAGIFAKISDKTLSMEAVITANVLSNMDKLFDALNSDSADLRRGKPYSTNMTINTPHLKLFAHMRDFFNDLKFVGSTRRPPSQEGWIWTLNAVELIFITLTRDKNIRSLATRRLQQDPLENLFGCIRGNCGSNRNPTSIQFVAGLKTAIVTRMANVGTTGNCENDSNIILNNLSALISISKPTQIPTSLECTFRTELSNDLTNDDISANIDEDSAEVQACAYVCGFLLKRRKIECSQCKLIFFAQNIKLCHLFVESKEYDEFKKKLMYASKEMITCVEHCATAVNKYLGEKGHQHKLKQSITQFIKETVNFDFTNLCPCHKIDNVNYIICSVFTVCIKRFCILKNRQFKDQASASALKSKINILLHK